MFFRVWRILARETRDVCRVSAAVVYEDLSDARPETDAVPALVYRFCLEDALVRCAATVEVLVVLSLPSVV